MRQLLAPVLLVHKGGFHINRSIKILDTGSIGGRSSRPVPMHRDVISILFVGIPLQNAKGQRRSTPKVPSCLALFPRLLGFRIAEAFWSTVPLSDML